MLHAARYVHWEATGMSWGDGNPNIVFPTLALYAPTNGFHHLIGNDYRSTYRTDSRNRTIVDITSLPMHRGYFVDQNVERIERYRHRDFPYLPEIEVQVNDDPDYGNVEGHDDSQALPSQYPQGWSAYGQEGYGPSYY